MKKTYLIASILTVALVVIGGVYLITNNDQTVESSNNQSTIQQPAPNPEPLSDTSTAQSTAETTESPVTNTASYISLDTYTQNTSAYASTKKIYFFHAPWCSICQGIDNEITADPSVIPAGTVIIKTDFDTNTDLRKKYGVTSQYTFVQTDNEGNELKQWSALNLSKALAGIQ